MTYKEQTIKKWKSWLEILRKEVHILLSHRLVFNETQQIIKDNLDIQKPSAFYNLLGQGYAALIVLGIRRQVKIDSKSISLAKLLAEISKQPNLVTRQDYIKLYEGSKTSIFADKTFDKFAGTGKNEIDSVLVAKDLEQLRKAVRSCEHYADRSLAHIDKRGSKKIPTFLEVNNALEILEKLIIRYELLLTAAGWTGLTPTFQYNWKSIFKYKWIDK
ncbi:MAG: hypothetical protein V1907_04625 [Candidatus Kerfeldbacteria bacterium]